MTRRRAGVVGVAGLATVALAAGVAWACTAISAVYSINPDAAPAGTNVVITGRDFHAKAIDIRWNSADGPVIGTTRGPDFEAQAQIPPDAAPGHYRVYAIQDGSLNPHISFRVIPAQSAPPAEQGGVAPSEEAGSGPPPPPSHRVDAPESPAPGPVAHDPGGELASADASGSEPSAATASRPASSSSSPGGAGPGSSSGAGGVRPSGPSTPPPSGGGPGTGATWGDNADSHGAAASAQADHQSELSAASRRSASGEVSFASPWKPTSPGQSLNEPAPKQRQGSPAGMGMALLALGVAGLAGATTAGLRRRAVLLGGGDQGGL